MKSCKNCSESFSGNYCSNCGQKFIDQRFQLRDSINWAFHSIFNLDHGFLYTSKEVIRFPKKVITHFISGITIRYSHPFRFIFIWATISALIGVYVGSYEDTSIAMNKALGMSDKQIEAGLKAREFMKQYMSFIIMIMVPFFSLGSYWLFKKKGNNYAEHLIVNSYAQSSSIIIGLPILITYYFFPHATILNAFSFGLGLIVITRVYKQVFEVNWLVAFIKYLLSLLIAIVLFSLTLGIVLILGGIVFKLIGVYIQ